MNLSAESELRSSIATAAVQESGGTAVIVCSDAIAAIGSTASKVAAGLPIPAGHFEAVDSLCTDYSSLAQHIERCEATTVIVALCSNEVPTVEIQTIARRAGADPLGIQVVNLETDGSILRAPAAFKRSRMAVLKAAVARAAAFSGSRPANARTVFISGDATLSRRALFTMPPVSYRPVPTINVESCQAPQGCNLCASACPHDALTVTGGAVQIERQSCASCGFCVAACPQRAVELPGWSEAEIEAQVRTAIAASGDAPARIAFTCRKSSGRESANHHPIEVRCAGMVPASAILQTLAMGATEVSVVQCSTECENRGGETVRSRVDYSREFLRAIGDSPTRVRLNPRPSDGLANTGNNHVSIDSDRPALLFGKTAASTAVLSLTPQSVRAQLQHAESPLGVVDVNPDTCTLCGTCATACPTGAITHTQADGMTSLTFDPAICVACGKCESTCPELVRAAIRMTPVTDTEIVREGQTVLIEERSKTCERCDAPVAPEAMLRRLMEMLGPEFPAERLTRFCNDCRAIGFSG
ncbi:MAG: 4Fe-4S binding protein [Chloroflexi bacterium]|nr:4Fe-4S binding protein [Chloroflexota bacterium]